MSFRLVECPVAAVCQGRMIRYLYLNIQTFIILIVCNCFTLPAQGQEGGPTAEQIRAMIGGQIRSFNIAPAKVFKVVNESLWTGSDSVRVRIYYPSAGKNKPAIFNIHGGALVAGDLDTHDNISRLLCNKTGSVVFALDYKKPPEHPYPAGFDDTWLVMKWIVTNASKTGIDKRKIVVVSDSGGSLFAAAMPAKLRLKNADIKIAGQVFINPALDLRNEVLAEANPMYKLVASWYLGNTNAEDSIVSPIAATDWTGFPASLIVVCENDELKPHGIALSEKLQAADIRAELLEIPREDHLGGFWAAGHPKANPAIDAAVKFILAMWK